MTITKDVNLGTIMPLIILMAVQTGGGIWWAATMNAKVDTAISAIANAEDESADENLRQWARINATETGVQQLYAANLANEQRMNNIKESLVELRFDIRQNNQLLRDVLSTQQPE